jgi:hypothetical protein
MMMAAVLVGLSGCHSVAGFLSPHGRNLIDGSCGHCDDCPETCQSCDCADMDCCGGEVACEPCAQQGCGLLDRCRARRMVNPGPPTGAVAYPYYTTRGPRDYFSQGNPEIGP